MRYFPSACVLICSALLSSCAGSKNLQTFDLQELIDSSAPNVQTKQTRFSLSVVEPTTLSALDSDRIAVREKDGGISYLSGAQWADRLPKLLQTQMVRHFENKGFIASVGKQSDRFIAQKSLLIDLRNFELDVQNGSSIHIALSAKLVDERTGKILKGRVFEISHSTSLQGVYSDQTFSEPMRQILNEIVNWLQSS